jgi:hypothetical protein
MYVPLGLYMRPMGLVCPLGALSCPLGLNYAPWGSIMPLQALLCPLGVNCPPLQACTPPLCMRPPPPLCVHAMGSFKPLEAHICPLEAQLCPLGVKCVSPSSVHAPLMRMRPPQECASHHQACTPPSPSVRASLPRCTCPPTRRARPLPGVRSCSITFNTVVSYGSSLC